MPEHHGARGIRRLRFWLIRRLARRDVIVLNTITSTPVGWGLYRKGLDETALICDNVWAINGWIAPPGTELLVRTEELAE